jgi:hypothetical protein
MYLLNALAAITNADSCIIVTMSDNHENVTLLLPNDATISIGYGRHHYGSGRFSFNPAPTIANVDSVEVMRIDRNGYVISVDGDDVQGYVPCTELSAIVAELSAI